MPASRPELRLGRILWVDVADFRNVVKRRHCVIISPTDEIEDDEPFSIVAISTSHPDPPPAECIELPWHPDRRRTVTRLNRRSAAVLTWTRSIRHDDIAELGGDVPHPLMVTILTKLRELRDQISEGEGLS